MGFFISILAIISPLLLSGCSSDAAKAGVIGGMMVIVLSVIVIVITFIYRVAKRSSSTVAKKVQDKVNTKISEYKIDKSYYAIAEQEVDSQNVDSGLWAKALVKAKGNEEVRKAEYIKLRAKQLQKEGGFHEASN